jgi:hypothetical protein
MEVASQIAPDTEVAAGGAINNIYYIVSELQRRGRLISALRFDRFRDDAAYLFERGTESIAESEACFCELGEKVYDNIPDGFGAGR